MVFVNSEKMRVKAAWYTFYNHTSWGICFYVLLSSFLEALFLDCCFYKVPPRCLSLGINSSTKTQHPIGQPKLSSSFEEKENTRLAQSGG